LLFIYFNILYYLQTIISSILPWADFFGGEGIRIVEEGLRLLSWNPEDERL